MNDDDYLDIRPWPPIELLGQLVAHVALGRRGLVELDDSGDVFERETDRFELDAWAKLELTAWLTADQGEILDTQLGNLSEAQLAGSQDALIVASTIGWAIHVVPVPTLPVSTDGGPEGIVLDWAPGPWTAVRNGVKAIRVRSDELLAIERERWELLAWRTTLFQDDESIDADQEALEETIAELAGQSLVETDGRDFLAAHRTPFNALEPDDFVQIAHEAELRLKTLNWVCGFGETPSTAPVFLED